MPFDEPNPAAPAAAAPKPFATFPEPTVVRGKEEEALRAALGWLVGPEAARRIVDRTGLVGPQRMTAAELALSAGIHAVVAERVVALRVLGRLLLPEPRETLSTPAKVLSMLPPGLFASEHERVVVVALDGRHAPKAVVQVAQGGGSRASMCTRDVFVPLARLGASCFVLVHNHPSGDPQPSDDDGELTATLAAAGELLGIPMLDHLIVVADGRHTSFYELGLLDAPKSRPRRRR